VRQSAPKILPKLPRISLDYIIQTKDHQATEKKLKETLTFKIMGNNPIQIKLLPQVSKSEVEGVNFEILLSASIF